MIPPASIPSFPPLLPLLLSSSPPFYSDIDVPPYDLRSPQPSISASDISPTFYALMPSFRLEPEVQIFTPTPIHEENSSTTSYENVAYQPTEEEYVPRNLKEPLARRLTKAETNTYHVSPLHSHVAPSGQSQTPPPPTPPVPKWVEIKTTIMRKDGQTMGKGSAWFEGLEVDDNQEHESAAAETRYLQAKKEYPLKLPQAIWEALSALFSLPQLPSAASPGTQAPPSSSEHPQTVAQSRHTVTDNVSMEAGAESRIAQAETVVGSLNSAQRQAIRFWNRHPLRGGN
ncbi:hypothetical protein DFH27DRAFT_609670 [Peziza echinospora]|nr:hypothetical protein DFH27DRAFT_609670 [Peziza echinospora]